MKSAAILLFAMAGVLAAGGQTAPVRSAEKPQVTPEAGLLSAQADLKANSYVTMSAIPGRPFSAQVVTTVTRTGEDGAPHTIHTRNLAARDAMGRWYRESRISGVTGGISPYGVSAQVWDPVEQMLLDLSIPQKIALVVRDEPANRFSAGLRARPRPHAWDMYAGDESVVVEDLGERTIDGTAVWGTRTTEIFAPEVMGSEKPLKKVIEEWYSDALAMDLEVHVVNPVRGDMTIRVEQVDLHEPDHSLFEVPPGFKQRFEQTR